MFRIRNLITALLVTAFAFLSTASADVNSVTPSTNAENYTKGWAHFVVLDTGFGSVEVEFVSLRGFASCFEYRTDGDASQSTGNNYNSDILDGLFPFTCVNNSTDTMTIEANQYVEIRMVFGAERDERFDWTRVDVYTKQDCKNGGWEELGFSNQGQCIATANTGE